MTCVLTMIRESFSFTRLRKRPVSFLLFKMLQKFESVYNSHQHFIIGLNLSPDASKICMDGCTYILKELCCSSLDLPFMYLSQVQLYVRLYNIKYCLTLYIKFLSSILSLYCKVNNLDCLKYVKFLSSSCIWISHVHYIR